MNLFRSEVIEAKRRKLWGDVGVSHPPSLTVWTLVCIGICCAALAAGTIVEFTRREPVTGSILPEGGVVQIAAPRSGVVSKVFVGEGETVGAGAQLVDLADTATSASGGLVITMQLAGLEQQDAALASRRQAITESFEASSRRIAAQIGSGRATLLSMEGSVAMQRDAVALAEQDYDRFKTLLDRGIASQSLLDQRRRQLILEKTSLQNLEREYGRIEGEMAQLAAERLSVWSQRRSDLAALDSDASSLESRRAELEYAAGQTLKAPVAGVVTLLSAQPGQNVQTGQALVSLISDGATLEAQLYVPSRGIGFMKAGQRTRLQVQAFPYQQFGFVDGYVRSISQSAMPPNDPAAPKDAKEALYRVKVSLSRQSVRAYGLERPLRAGMAVNADIETDRRRLWQQLFEPLIAAGRLSFS